MDSLDDWKDKIDKFLTFEMPLLMPHHFVYPLLFNELCPFVKIDAIYIGHGIEQERSYERRPFYAIILQIKFTLNLSVGFGNKNPIHKLQSTKKTRTKIYIFTCQNRQLMAY